jgi:hypothetical protein
MAEDFMPFTVGPILVSPRMLMFIDLDNKPEAGFGMVDDDVRLLLVATFFEWSVNPGRVNFVLLWELIAQVPPHLHFLAILVPSAPKP